MMMMENYGNCDTDPSHINYNVLTLNDVQPPA